MITHRRLKLLLVSVMLLGAIVWGSWLEVRAKLAELGVERFEVSGVELGWNRVAFESVSLTWAGDGRSVLLETLQPALTMDWRSWQLSRLVASSARVVQAVPGVPDAVDNSSGSPEAFRLTLSDSVPFWLPRHLSVNSLEAVFPCRGSQCHFRGKLRFDRGTDSANAQVDATLSRDQHTLTVEGDVQLGSGAEAGAVTKGELTVTGLRPWLHQAGNSEWQRLAPRSATLRFSPAEDQGGPGQWPMKVVLTTEGGASPAFEGQVVLHTADPWRLDIRHGRLTGSLNEWRHADWLLDDLRADLPVKGIVSADGARLMFLRGASLRAHHLDPLEAEDLMWLDNLVLSVDNLALIFADGQVQLEGPVGLAADEIRHPALITQAWQMTAEVQYTQQLGLTGTLSNAAGAGLPFQVRYHPDEGLEATGTMTLTPDNQANYMAGTLASWPKTLTLDGGRAELAGQVSWPSGSDPAGGISLDFAGLSGLYEEMAWQGLSGEVGARLNDGSVSLSAGDLVLDKLNPGMTVGPVRLSADYQATVASPMAGRLALATAEAGFAGGALSVNEQVWHLDEPPWQVPVEVEGLELSALMNLYPTEGLAGEGILKGQLPVTVGPRGIRIEGGHISALPPGGRLQLPADKLQAMAQGNAAMALVAGAMEDFHYRVLESDIDYAEDGTLVLDLQLRGSSPKVDSERPVVLNINLEENIPALLTSLQLSGRVNDAVTERVRERFRQEGTDTQ